MNKSHLLLAAALLSAFLSMLPAEAKDTGRVIKGQTQEPVQSDDRLQGHVNTAVKTAQPWSNLGFAYVLDNSKNFALDVTQVAPNSPAFKAGLQRGDKILDVKVSPSGTNLQVLRGGKQYVASITAPASEVNTFKADERLGHLAAHKLVVLIDMSGSMFERDCPGNLTRWDWCRNETLKVGTALSGRFGKDITVATFANWYRMYQHCSLADIQRIFMGNMPAGDTQPQFPMNEVFDDYFKSNRTDPRPLMVAVVTDGIPTQPLDVADTIMSAVKRMSYPGEVKVTFLQIADDPRAQSILSAYDSDLVHEGARYDIVDYVDFGDVMQRGLLESLIDSANGQLSSSVAQRPYSGNLHRTDHGMSSVQNMPVYDSSHNVRNDRYAVEDRLLNKYRNK